MEDKSNLFETLLERAADYGRTSFELIKLKTLEKIGDVISSFVPSTVVFIMFATFMLFVNLGLALWLGEILENIFFGFFAVAAFYGIAALIFHFLLRKWIKKVIFDYIIKQLFK